MLRVALGALKTTGAAMTLGELLLGRVRDGSQELWRGVRRRVGFRVFGLWLLLHGGFFGILWLLGDAWQAGRHRDVALGMARVLLPTAGIVGGFLMALRGSLHALLVLSPFLRTMADLLRDRRMPWEGGDPTGQLAAFASPRALAGAARIRDLPLMLFLSRAVLRLDAKSLLHAARTGVGRGRVLGEMERQVRDRSARSLRRLTVVIWFGLTLAVALPFTAGQLFR